MNKEDIIRMAREVWGQTAILPFDDIERFAQLVAAAEREACAKVCIEIGKKFPIGFREFDCADAIRARGQQ